MNSRESFEAWYQNEYVQFGRANFHFNIYGEYFDDDIEASWCAWQAALASQEPTLKNNEFIPDSTEGRIQAAIKCLNMHWVSHDANRFDYAIEGLEKCLAALASQAQQESQWISVEKRLPEIGEEVIVFKPKSERYKVTVLARFIRYEEDTEYYWEASSGRGIMALKGSVTHWMPLPKRPNED